MNLREGTRRLALLLGVAGLIFGCFVSYLQVQSTTRQRADHKRYERLAKSPIVEQARKTCFGPSEPPKYTIGDAPKPKYTIGDAPKETQPSVPKRFKFNAPYCFTPNGDQFDYTPSELSGSIKIVHFENRQIESVETQDGQTFYPTPAPSAWSYVLIAILPLVGFFVPWGAIRAIGWVISGFIQTSR